MKRLTVFLALPILSACAAKPASQAWIHPEWGSSYTSRDLSVCRKQADEDLGRQIGRNDMLDRDPAGGNTSPTRQTDAIRNRYDVDRYVANCMMGLGYRRAKAAN
ncbi:conserved exported hypothetical protein [Rhodospirillaceae bacterium LM-1]|nr:conserved exported hypothetical protein [Rhodospirillaceae bacterium LM-1]